MCSFFSFFKNSANKYFSYLINDPSTPELIENIVLPKETDLKFKIRNLSFDPKNSKEQQALNCYITISNLINYIEKNIKIKNWASNNKLEIIPQAGVDLNAYYDRRSLKFFYYQVLNKTIFTSDSSDIVAHELGHAILDAIRPDFWSVQSLEIWSFHEAFSDICAIVSIMQYDSILEENFDNNFSNSVTKLAEEVGMIIYKLGGNKKGSLKDCLRDPSVEKYKYVNPNNLPNQGRDNQLLSECHSFGRVFSAAWYQIFIKIYKKELENTNDSIASIKKARDIAFFSLLKSIKNSPKVVNYYNAIAKCMINQCNMDHPEYAEIVEKVFIDWNIISNKIKIMSNYTIKDIEIKNKDIVVKSGKNTIVRLVRNDEYKINRISMLSNKYNNVKIEVPNEKYYEFDKNGNLIDEISNDQSDIEKNIDLCIIGIQNNSNQNMWKIKNNKLERNFFI